ncbi:hypothetical protein K438DRAFT_107530 [Mycena galopus ATCC 62051]|nr:hypothetical protein K438DRAFT_107530 [Mycena galopus ATCC 62051]
MSTPTDPALLQLVADSRLTGYLAIASLCVLVYDHIDCMPEEVDLMWKSQWGLAKIIFLWNRYFSLVVVSLNTSVIVRDIRSSEVRWLQVQGSSSIVLIATVDFVLMLRVWILYGRPRWIVYVFSFLVVSEVLIMIIVDVAAFRQMRDYVHLGTIIKGCYAYNVPRFLSVFAAAPLIVTLVIFIMTLYKCVPTLYHADHRLMPFWSLFLRDGAVWFLLVFAAGGAELLIWATQRQSLKQVLLVPALVVYSGVSSRSLLNIKRMMVAEQETEISIDRNVSEPIVYLAS